MKKTLFAGVSVGLCILASATSASAQSIYYGALEQLFNEPVTTSATGAPQRSTEVPAAMAIISAADIKRSGAYDIPSVLSRVAGVDVYKWGAAGADVGVRGYNQAFSPRLLVLIDGRQVYMDHYGYTAWAALPIQLGEIRQIEVVKGPNSALFGFNAVSGVVNIITYNPKFDDISGGSTQVGTDGLRALSVYQTIKLGDRVSARFSAGAREEDERSDPTNIIPVKRDPWRVNGNLKVIAQVAKNTEFDVEGSWSNLAFHSVAPNQSYNFSKYSTHSVKAGLQSETSIGNLQASIYRNISSVEGGFTGLAFKNTVTVASAQNTFKVGARNTFRIGGEFRDNKLPTTPVKGGEVSYNVYALSGLWNLAVNSKLALTVSARHDTLSLKRTGAVPVRSGLTNALWDRDIKEVSYNLGAVYQPTATDTLRVTAARGVQAPSLVQFGGFQLQAGPSLITGDPAIEPAIVTNQELAYSRDFNRLKAKAGVSVFRQKTEDIKSSSLPRMIAPTATTNAVFTPAATSDSRMYGLEAYAEGDLDGGYNWSVNYTYTDIKDTATSRYSLPATFTAFASTTPKSRLNASLGWESGPWTIDGYARYVSRSQGYDTLGAHGLVPIDAYATLGGRIGRDLGQGLTLSLSGQNLLDDSQRQTAGLPAQTEVVLGLAKAW